MLLLATAWLGGCRAAQTPGLLIESAFAEVEWFRDGFRIEGSGRRFRYTCRHQREEGALTLWTEYREKAALVDKGMDGTVDEIRIGLDVFKRGAPGRDELFAQADEKLTRHSDELRVPEHIEKWRAAGPDGVAELRGVGSY